MKPLKTTLVLCATILFCVGTVSGCANPCEKLAETVCDDHSAEKEKCQKWKEVASTMKEESCSESLKALEALK